MMSLIEHGKEVSIMSRLTKEERLLIKFDDGIRPCRHEACKDMLSLWEKGACVIDMLKERVNRK